MLSGLQCQYQTVDYYQGWLAGKSRTVEHLDAIKAPALRLKDQKNILAGLAQPVVQNVDDTKANLDPSKIQGKILEKPLRGGYG